MDEPEVAAHVVDMDVRAERLAAAEHVQRLLLRIALAAFVLNIVVLIALLVIALVALRRFTDTQASVNGQTCLILKQTTVETQGTRELFDAFATHFGVRVRFPALPVGKATVHCKPTGGDDVILGNNRNNTLRGTNSADFIAGFGGRDIISGRNGDDTEFGGTGNDRMWAGNGADTLHGDAGNDVLNARADDHAKDYLDGGAGFDTCYVNHGDKTNSCERVIRV